MKIGIFGGCFNPPHKAHKSIALKLIKNKYLDKVIYVPTGNKYNKKELISDRNRYDMLNIICQNNKNIFVSDYEFNNTLTYTYQTLDHFQKAYPDDDIYFICGADNILDIENWKNSKYLLNTYKFIAINRNNDDISMITDKYPNKIIVANIKQENISSTEIRDNIKIKDLNYLKKVLDEKVLKYITKNNLYEIKEEKQ